MLTLKEKETLYSIISNTLGEDIAIRNRLTSFTDQTVSAVETMLSKNKKCNANIATLVADPTGAADTLQKGWLKKLIKTPKEAISKLELKGYDCLVSVNSKWKTAILSSTIWAWNDYLLPTYNHNPSLLHTKPRD